MTRDKFYDIVERAIPRLPKVFKEALDNVEIIVRNRPDRETRENIEKDGILLGLYVGVPITRRGSGYGSGFYGMVPPDRIFLYQKNLEKYCRVTGENLTDQIIDTLFHEIGHYMGLGEEEVRAMKYDAMKKR